MQSVEHSLAGMKLLLTFLFLSRSEYGCDCAGDEEADTASMDVR
jgi:hypothetical protein